MTLKATIFLVLVSLTISCDLGEPVPQWRPPVYAPKTREIGIGLLTFALHNPYAQFQTDSIEIFLEPSDSSQKLGSFVQEKMSDGGYRYVVPQLPSSGHANSFEYGYEVAGLPFDSVVNRWHHVIYGFLEGDIPQAGWSRLDTPRIGSFRWATVLPNYPLFFSPRPENPEFFDTVNGSNISFPLQRSYIMHPLAIDSVWIKVRVVTPGDMCDSPANPQIGVFWIRYLDSRGRPYVFYYTRGC